MHFSRCDANFIVFYTIVQPAFKLVFFLEKLKWYSISCFCIFLCLVSCIVQVPGGSNRNNYANVDLIVETAIKQVRSVQ